MSPSGAVLIVFSPDRRFFDLWVRSYGLCIKDTSLVYASSSDDENVRGWPRGTFWTVLEGVESPAKLDPSYRYVSAASIEKAVRNSGRNRPVLF